LTVRQPHISKTLLLRFTGAGSLYVTYSGVPMQPEKTTLDISADVTLRTWKSNCAFGADSVMMKKVWIETPANGYLSEFYSSSRKTMYSPDGSYAKLVHFANDNSTQRGIEVEGFMLTENQNYNPWQPDVVYDESLQGLKVNSTTLIAKNNYACIADYGSIPLKIYLNDKVDAVLLEDGLSAIESQNANVYIYGPGSLTINNGNYGAGIYLDEYDLTIAQDATVNIISETDQSMGISLAGGALTVDKANLTVQGYPSLMGVSNLTMNGGVGILSKGHTFSTTKQSIVDATGEATNEQVVIAIDPTSVDDVSSDSSNGQVESVKVLQDGQLLILRGGKTYNLLGVEVR